MPSRTIIRASVYLDLARYAKDALQGTGLDQPTSWGEPEPVDLIDPHDPLDEIVTTLLYRVSHAPYRSLLAVVRTWTEKQKQEAVDVAMSARGPYDELIKEFRSGYAFTFDVLMDIGGWRDMHRHRRCQQIQQNFTTVHGYEVPPPLVQAGLDQEYRQAMDAVRFGHRTARENECGGIVALRDAVWIQGALPVQDGLCRSRVHRQNSAPV